MKKILLFALLLLTTSILIVGCTDGNVSDEEIESELSELSDEELESIVAEAESLDGGNIAGQASFNKISVRDKSYSAEKVSTIGKKIIEEREKLSGNDLTKTEIKETSETSQPEDEMAEGDSGSGEEINALIDDCLSNGVYLIDENGMAYHETNPTYQKCYEWAMSQTNNDCVSCCKSTSTYQDCVFSIEDDEDCDAEAILTSCISGCYGGQGECSP